MSACYKAFVHLSASSWEMSSLDCDRFCTEVLELTQLERESCELHNSWEFVKISKNMVEGGIIDSIMILYEDYDY